MSRNFFEVSFPELQTSLFAPDLSHFARENLHFSNICAGFRCDIRGARASNYSADV